MWDQLNITKNPQCACAAELRAKINMRVLRVQHCAGKKFYLTVSLKEPVFCGMVYMCIYLYNKMQTFDSLR